MTSPIHGRDSERFARFMRLANDPNDYATLQPNLSYFDTPEATIAYRDVFGSALVIADPLAASKDASREALGDFLGAHPGAMFVNITPATAHLLAQHSPGRHRFVPFGTEWVLDCAQVLKNMPKKARGALKKARRASWRVEELDWSSMGRGVRERVLEIDTTFLKNSTAGHEIPLLARHMMHAPEPSVRFFAMFHTPRGASEEIFGFFTLDPWRRGGKAHGVQLHQIRMLRTPIWGVYLSVVATLCEQLLAEGCPRLSLGACALHLCEQPDDFPRFMGSQALLSLAAKHADRVHSLTNLTQMKLAFPGTPIRRYLCAPSSLPIKAILAILWAAGVVRWPRGAP